MPNVNPPADAEQARRDPEMAIQLMLGGGEIRVGRRKEADTLPDRAVFRFVIAEIGGEQYTGYLWRA